MKKLLLVLAFLSAAALAWFGYERLFVQKSFGPAAMIAFGLIAAFLAFTLISVKLLGTRHRGTVGGIWMAGIITLGFYLIADAVIGHFLIVPLNPALVPDMYRHHKLVPDGNFRIQEQEFAYTQHVNKLGLRGAETTLEKPADVYRILMLGDSFTVGRGVKDEETFSVLLQAALNAAPAGSCRRKKIEVLNGGTDSYAPILSYIQFRRDLAPLEPDLVVFNLDNGDLVQEAAYRKVATYAADGSPLGVPNVGRNASSTDRIHDWIDQHLFFTRALLYHASVRFGGNEINVRNVATHINRELVANTLAGDAVPRDQQWKDVFASIDLLRAAVAEQGGEYLVTMFPWGHQVNDTEWIPGRYDYMSREDVASDQTLDTVRQMAAERGLRLADLYPVFRAYRGAEKLYYSRDNHWTPTGHRVMAEGLAQYLRENFADRWCE
jgi:lysophospholipase L1-like esterase